MRAPHESIFDHAPSGMADEGYIGLYSQGWCHVFAIAANRLWGGDGFIVARDPYETIWEDDENPENVINAVIHVYAAFRHEDKIYAADIFGLRPASDIGAEIPTRFSAFNVDLEDLPDESDLRALIESDDVPFAPLMAIDEDMISRATAIVLEAFPEGPLGLLAGKNETTFSSLPDIE